MSARRTGTILIGVALVAALAGTALASGFRDRDGATRARNATATGGGRSAAVVVGSAPLRGLYPGAEMPLALTVYNPNRFAVAIRSITVAVAPRTTKRGCSGSRQNIRVIRHGRARLVVRPRTRARVVGGLREATRPVFGVAMPHSVANACQGATFRLRYRAVGARR